MKKSELRKLVSKYKTLTLKLKKRNLSHNPTILEKLEEIKHRYFHETGNDIEFDLKSNAEDTA
ncbi:MAG: hypothetical protein HZA84_09800 [Thaumarchaeota archaeon]|nr:hypothetical protein [Nitrososphaerota archaeon]